MGTSIEERVKKWRQIFSVDKRVLVFDILLWLLISVGYTLWVFEVVSCKQAFLSGLTAESVIYAYLSNIRRKTK